MKFLEKTSTVAVIAIVTLAIVAYAVFKKKDTEKTTNTPTGV